MVIDASKLKVAELRDELSARGLSAKGLKTELVARLQEFLDSGSVIEAGPCEAEKSEEKPLTSPRRGRSTRSKPAAELESDVKPESLGETEEVEEEEVTKSPAKRGRPGRTTRPTQSVKEPEEVLENTLASEEMEVSEAIGATRVGLEHQEIAEHSAGPLEPVAPELPCSADVETINRQVPEEAGKPLSVESETFAKFEKVPSLELKSDYSKSEDCRAQPSDEAPQLDELFRKTAAEPSIYYLPKVL